MDIKILHNPWINRERNIFRLYFAKLIRDRVPPKHRYFAFSRYTMRVVLFYTKTIDRGHIYRIFIHTYIGLNEITRT